MLEWLDPRGRCSNGDYVRIALLCSAVAAPLVGVLAVDGLTERLRLPALAMLWLVTCLMWLVAIRRAHDEGYRAYEAYAWMGGPTLLLLVWLTLPALGVLPHELVLWLSYGVGMFLCYVGLYAVAHASEGATPNAYGPPTLQRPSREDRLRYQQLRSSKANRSA